LLNLLHRFLPLKEFHYLQQLKHLLLRLQRNMDLDHLLEQNYLIHHYFLEKDLLEVNFLFLLLED
jgi:hypothetical protein